MPSLAELRSEAKQLDDELIKFREEVDAAKKAGKSGDDMWGGAEKRKRFREVHERRNVIREQMAAEQDEADLLASAEEARRARDGGGDRRESRSGKPSQRSEERRERERGDESGGDERGERRSLSGRQVELRRKALRAWANYGREDRSMSREEREACRELGFNPRTPGLSIDLSDTSEFRHVQREVRGHRQDSLLADIERRGEFRALSASSGPAGAYTIPATLVRNLEINLLAYGGVEQYAEVILTDTGEEMGWPSTDDTSNEGEMLGENVETDNDEEPTFKRQRWGSYEFSSKAVKVPNQLLDDDAVGLDAILPQFLAERVGRAGNRKFTVGTGDNQPRGIVTAAEVGRTTSSATAITGDDFRYLYHSVDPAYRESAGAAWMMHDTIVLQASLLKDTTGQPIWASHLSQGAPDRCYGRPVAINQHMDSALAASNVVALFGDVSRYKIRRVRKVFIKRLTEKYAESNQTAFLLIVRQDGNLLNAGTCPVKKLKMAAS